MIDAKQPDWKAVHEAHFLYEDNCWTECNSFCCSNNHPDFAFQLLPVNGQALLYLKEEYEYFKEFDRVPEFHGHKKPPQPLSLDFGGPELLTTIQTPCYHGGLCEDIIAKPLLCKLYPFMPIFDVDGNVDEIYASSVYDVTLDVIGEPSPCTVHRKRDEYLKRWREPGHEVELLCCPQIMLFLFAVKHFIDVYENELRNNNKLNGLSGTDFWKTWEIQYLSGRLFNMDEIKTRIKSSYDLLKDKYGEFSY